MSENINEQYYLVTYEWRQLGRHSSPDFKRENKVIKGCPGLWFAELLEWYRDYEEKGREKAKEYAERGEMMPVSEDVRPTENRFLYATPISKEGYEALDGVVG